MDLVKIENLIVHKTIPSLQLAEMTGKQYGHILRDIEDEKQKLFRESYKIITR